MADDLGNSDSAAFVFEGEIEPLVNRVLDHHLMGKFYDEASASPLSNFICEDIMQGLTRLEKPFKYVVNCVLMQNTGAALHAVQSEFLDGMNDGAGTVRWPQDRIKEPTNFVAVVTVFGISMLIGQS
jgi:dynein light chain Tctex-type 1